MNNYKSSTWVHLEDLTAIQVYGSDAFSFLQNQITSDLNLVTQNQGKLSVAALSGFCTPQGRLTASFWISPYENESDSGYTLWTSKDISEYLVKRLKIFVLRSKVKIEPIPLEYSILGFWGDLDQLEGHTPNDELKQCIQLPSVEIDGTQQMRFLALSTNKFKATIDQEAIDFWSLLEVKSGIPRITKPTQEKFVPQMINFESLNGVGFQKGCYPGQEVVARSQYRGVIKRRLFIYSIEVSSKIGDYLSPGTEIFDMNQPDQPAGMVVLCGMNRSEQRIYMQLELKIESSKSDLGVQIDSGIEKFPFRLEVLPYQLVVI